MVEDPPPAPAIGSYWITRGTQSGTAFAVKAIVIGHAIYGGREVFVVEVTDDLSAAMLPEGAGARTLYVDESTYNVVAEFYDFQLLGIRYAPHDGQLRFPLGVGSRWRSRLRGVDGAAGRWTL